MEEFYKKCEYDIRTYKTPDMKCSRQIISGNNKLGMLVGLTSLLQSCLENNVITEEDLQKMINAITEAKKSGVKNKVLFSNWEAKNE